jgi:hypothetical protein
LPYKYYRYPKVSRNSLEEQPRPATRAPEQWRYSLLSRGPDRIPAQDTNEGLLGPHKLFILNNPESRELHGARLIEIGNWTDYQTRHPNETTYIFAAYTAKQFSPNNFDILHTLAERAAREAGASAFWVASECLDHSNPEDVSNSCYLIQYSC